MVRMMGSSLEAGLGDIFNEPDERILKAVEKAGNRCVCVCLHDTSPLRQHSSPPCRAWHHLQTSVYSSIVCGSHLIGKRDLVFPGCHADHTS